MRPEQPTPELKRLAGQMRLGGCRGAEPSDENGQPLPILSQVAELNLGGVILFDRDAALGIPDRNIKSPEQVQRLTSALSLAATNAGLPPLFIAVDQEGGRVQRLKPANGFPDSPAAAELCPEAPQAQSAADSAPALTAGAATGRMLREAGFNLDFAPVCDVNVNPDNPVIGKIGRSFSADTETSGGLRRSLCPGPARPGRAHGGQALPRPRLQHVGQPPGFYRRQRNLDRGRAAALR